MKIPGEDSPQLRQTRQVVQMSFPQIYLACHTRHERKRSNPKKLSTRDAAILAHLDRSVAIPPSKLASHLGISASTLSEALKRLAGLGLVAVPAEAGSVRRRVSVVLTEGGAAALSDTSVLETQKLEEILAESTSQELRTISTGIALLASACRSHSDKARRLRGTPK
jgi:DNA-binding MarR family transcriptional regulator